MTPPRVPSRFVVGMLDRAQESLDGAGDALRRAHLALATRLAQECVELSLKAVLRWAGFDPPRHHEVGPLLTESIGRFPLWFRKSASEFAELSSELAGVRSRAVYGDATAGVGPAKLLTDRGEVEAWVRRSRKLLEA